MGKFQCVECGYGFTSKEETPKKCPYCGEKAVISEPNAEDLLEEI